MKPTAFEYARPSSIEEAVRLLAEANGAAKVLAGGQSLGPMMRLRLAKPSMLVDVRRIPEITSITAGEGDLSVGAALTHAEVEDGKLPDTTRGMMRFVASGIAYRAVRNAGTIGGSLAHADPSADWITCLSALGAKVSVTGPKGTRQIPVDQLMVSAFETALAPSEIITRVHIPNLSARARWAFNKFCRKTGELAVAMCAVVIDPLRAVARVAIGATESRPIVIADATSLLSSPMTSRSIIYEGGHAFSPATAQIHATILRRTLEQAARP
ncbi:MAG TPA: FAD binding domain-containing protein [Bauldia sp.]|nr:FAD binding domain-containing protein [Bauldia sp.]